MTANRDIDFRIFARGAGKMRKCARGDVIFREGDPADFTYIILTGSVEIESHGKFIETIGGGRALGFASLIDNGFRGTTARALEDCDLAVMDVRKFRYMVDEVPNFAWYVMHELTHRMRMLNAAIEEKRKNAA